MIKSETNPLVRHVVARESVLEESACLLQEVDVSPAHNDSSKRPRLSPAQRGPVWLYDDTANKIDH